MGGGVDRELTSYVMATGNEKKALINTLWSSPTRQKLMESTARYDDVDDRLLIAHSLSKWESAYVVSAFTHVEAQETSKGFIKQQIRWKKGFLRSNFYLGTFFWKGRIDKSLEFQLGYKLLCEDKRKRSIMVYDIPILFHVLTLFTTLK